MGERKSSLVHTLLKTQSNDASSSITLCNEGPVTINARVDVSFGRGVGLEVSMRRSDTFVL